MSNTTQSKDFPSSDVNPACVVVIDGQPIYRKGLRHVILDNTEYQLVLEASNTLTAQQKIKKGHEVGLIIASLEAGEPDTQSMIKDIKTLAPGVPFLIIAAGVSRLEILDVIDQGASGFAARNSTESEFVRILETIGGGAIHISATVLQQADAQESIRAQAQSPLRPQGGSGQGGAIAGLTRRQQEVLVELGHAQSNKVIAEKLQISESTVKIHVASILRSLGATNRTQAALMAQKKFG